MTTQSNTGFIRTDKNDKTRRIAAATVAPVKQTSRGKQWHRPSINKRQQYDVN